MHLVGLCVIYLISGVVFGIGIFCNSFGIGSNEAVVDVGLNGEIG